MSAQLKHAGTVASMIGYLSGTARGESIVVDSAGVGWSVSCPTPLVDGEKVALEVVTVMRDSSIALFGFTSMAERECFEALTRVSGVGPSIALAILATLSPSEVSNAVARKDAKLIAQSKGVGVKLAERIVAMASLPQWTGDSGGHDDLLEALVGMGFDAVAARDALASARSRSADDTEALAGALALLRGTS